MADAIEFSESSGPTPMGTASPEPTAIEIVPERPSGSVFEAWGVEYVRCSCAKAPTEIWYWPGMAPVVVDATIDESLDDAANAEKPAGVDMAVAAVFSAARSLEKVETVCEALW